MEADDVTRRMQQSSDKCFYEFGSHSADCPLTERFRRGRDEGTEVFTVLPEGE